MLALVGHDLRHRLHQRRVLKILDRVRVGGDREVLEPDRVSEERVLARHLRQPGHVLGSRGRRDRAAEAAQHLDHDVGVLLLLAGEQLRGRGLEQPPAGRRVVDQHRCLLEVDGSLDDVGVAGRGVGFLGEGPAGLASPGTAAAEEGGAGKETVAERVPAGRGGHQNFTVGFCPVMIACGDCLAGSPPVSTPISTELCWASLVAISAARVRRSWSGILGIASR